MEVNLSPYLTLHEPEHAFVDFQALAHFGFMVPMRVGSSDLEALHEPGQKEECRRQTPNS